MKLCSFYNCTTVFVTNFPMCMHYQCKNCLANSIDILYSVSIAADRKTCLICPINQNCTLKLCLVYYLYTFVGDSPITASQITQFLEFSRWHLVATWYIIIASIHGYA